MVSYLCRSFISAGDQEEPYRVSCHCFKVPGLRLSSPGEEMGWSSGELSHLTGWHRTELTHGRRAAELAAPQDTAWSCWYHPMKAPWKAGLTDVPDDQPVRALRFLAPAPDRGEGPVSKAIGVPAKG